MVQSPEVARLFRGEEVNGVDRFLHWNGAKAEGEALFWGS